MRFDFLLQDLTKVWRIAKDTARTSLQTFKVKQNKQTNRQQTNRRLRLLQHKKQY